jgi:hypothetical protein
VWFDDWSVWPSGQRMHIFERFLASYGHRSPLIDALAFLFAPDEYEDLVSFVTIGAFFCGTCASSAREAIGRPAIPTTS